MTQKELSEISREYFEKMSVMGSKILIVKYLPFFAVKPWSSILDFLLDKFFSKLSEILDKFAYFAYTDLRVSQEGRKFVAAKLALKNAQTDEEKKRYEQDVLNALDALVSFK